MESFDCLENTDILVNILSRLDSPSIARSRLVSKSWYAASTSQDFLKNHYKPQEHDSLPWVVFTVVDYPDEYYVDPDEYNAQRNISPCLWRPFSGHETNQTSLSPDPSAKDDYLRFFSTSNGLVCGKDDYSIVVGNPVTHEWEWLSDPWGNPRGSDLIENGPAEISLDPSTGIYKVLFFGCRVTEYSSGTGEWSDIQEVSLSKRRLSWDKIEVDLEGWPTCMYSEIDVFTYKGKEYMATEMSRRDRYYRCGVMQVGIGVWELEPWNKRSKKRSRKPSWRLVSKMCAEDLLNGWVSPIHGDMLWNVYLLKDVLIFEGERYPPMAFHMVDKTWECGLSKEDIERFGSVRWDEPDPPAGMRCTYAFFPNLVDYSP